MTVTYLATPKAAAKL